MPQLIYWKHVTGTFIFDTGSAWDFLTPHLRVLFGWEKGWFIYTPITIFFIAGMFFMRKYPFKKAVLWFCLINIYIIISWRDWRYGGSYSTRALMQSYPVFALPLAAFTNWIWEKKWWKYAFIVLAFYLIYVNLFQIDQYYSKVLHYNDMNRKSYCKAYLNKTPTPLEMSLFDNSDWLKNEKQHRLIQSVGRDSTVLFSAKKGDKGDILEINLEELLDERSDELKWLKIELQVKMDKGYDGSYINSELVTQDSAKHNKIRVFRPLGISGNYNGYAFYVHVPEYFQNGDLSLYLSGSNNIDGEAKDIRISCLN